MEPSGTAWRTHGSDQIFSSVEDVRRMAEISDVCDLAGRPVQQHEIFRLWILFLGIEYQDGGASLDQTRHQMPVADLGIIAEIARHFRLAAQLGPADEIELHVVRNHGADRVEVPRVEMRDIGAEARTIGIR